MKDHTKAKAVEILNKILEMELAGTIHYTHYSFMVFGYNRIPIVSWLEQQATESIAHAPSKNRLSVMAKIVGVILPSRSVAVPSRASSFRPRVSTTTA